MLEFRRTWFLELSLAIGRLCSVLEMESCLFLVAITSKSC